MKRGDLTPRQIEVIEATEDVVLVLGGPGSGKTTTALWTAREVLDRGSLAPWQRVLFLTFSRTAVGQIGRRAPGVFGGPGARIEIATFHGFAWRLIRAFGRYAGCGRTAPPLQSPARIKLFGKNIGDLTYDDLVPTVRGLLASRRIGALVARRWPLVICDEFQDTDDEQWTLLTTLGHHSRLVLLADPNQMIYTFLRQRGVGPQRLARGRAVAGRIVELETRSHRDPSGIIPAMAEAIRRRDFFAQAPREAFRTGRLRVLRDIQDDALPPLIQDEVRRVRAAGARTVGIFGHSNEGVATLGAALEQVGLDHVLVGLPEAHGEALVTLATLCAYSAGLVGLPDVRLALATFLTACTRGDHAPPLAIRLAEGTPLPPALTHRLGEIERRLRQANGGTMAEVISIASRAWEELGITAGIRPWRRACADFAAFARPVAVSPVTVEAAQILVSQAERRRPVALVEFDATRLGPVQLMNFHQTKGREEDAVILVYRTRDYLADRREDEPYEEASRVLFVSLTRARQRVTVILPRDPHPLVAPFVQLA